MSTHRYGPNSVAVRSFLVHFAGLGETARHQAIARHATLSITRPYVLADATLGDVIAKSGREEMRDALSGPLLQLLRRDPSSSVPAAGEEFELDPVGEPALAALLALMVRDLLQDSVFRVLTDPFRELVDAIPG